MHENPGVNFSIDVTNKTKVVENLQENSVDFALVSVIPPNLSLNCIQLMKNELLLISSTRYPKLPKRMLTRDLEKHTLIFREKGSATRNAMTNFLNKNHVVVKRSIQLTSNEAVKQAVKAGLGLSIMPKIGIGSELKLKNLTTVPIKGLPITTQWNLVYGNGKKLSPAGLALIEYIASNKAKIIEEQFSD